MTVDYWRRWARPAAIRAIKTFAQTFAGFVTVGLAATEIDWKYAVSVAFVAGVYSICTSLAGIPEVGENGEALSDDED